MSLAFCRHSTCASDRRELLRVPLRIRDTVELGGNGHLGEAAGPEVMEQGDQQGADVGQLVLSRSVVSSS